MNENKLQISKIALGCYILLSLGTGTLIMLCWAVTILPDLFHNLVFKVGGESAQPIEVNLSDPFIKEREKEFHLSRVIPKYDIVITAIERYRLDHGSYPAELKLLVPDYLAQEPGIYLRSGEYLRYETKPWMGDTPMFTFFVYGHYPFPAFMHGWYLQYCPTNFPGCAPGGDRHSRSFRVNEHWIWISSSAL